MTCALDGRTPETAASAEKRISPIDLWSLVGGTTVRPVKEVPEGGEVAGPSLTITEMFPLRSDSAMLSPAMSGPATRKIIHVDMDAFYASVEQRDDPSLRGRPVAVGHAAKRGVVAAASYEARSFGVRSAMPATTALRKCPELIFAPPRFEVYRAVSRQIHAIFADYTHLIEPLSLDEAYLDVTDNLRGIPTASATASEIRARISDKTRLTASAGISYNKFLAKLASDHRNPTASSS